MFPLSYLLWQYTGGIQSVFRIWWNYLRFVLHLFNIGELFLTLISPWKRDVTPKSWRGFELARSLERITWNVFSRTIGMIVRSAIIIFGVVVLLLTLIGGVLAIFLWLAAIPSVAYFFSSLVTGSVVLSVTEIESALLSVAMLVLSLTSYSSRLPDTFLPKDRGDLCGKKWFPRVLGRLGLSMQNFRIEEWLSDASLEERLKELNVSYETFDEIVAYEADAAERREKKSRSWLWENMRKTVPIGRGWEYGYTVHLDRYCTDLSEYDFSEYRDLRLYGRESELQVTTLIMRRQGQNDILLVGDAGIGKMTFVHALARKIREGDLPEFKHLRVLVFDLGMAVGDAMNRGEDMENSLRYLFSQAAYAGNIVLVIENLDQFLGATSGTSRPNLAPLFAEFLGMSTFQVIGTMSTVGYHAIVRADDSIVKSFEAVYLREPDESATTRILLNIMEPVERRRVVFTWKSLKAVFEMSGEFNWDAPYPEKAIDLAQQTLLRFESNMDTAFILPSTVASFVSLKTGMPVGALEEDEKEKLLHLEEILHRRVIGQDEAVRQVSDALRRARAGFGNPARPLGSFLFLGPTGVGKTETAKALAEAYFGSEDRMIRLDMSEFQGPDAAERLIGSEATRETGHLTEAAKSHPYGVILLDEIEKAYPKALDIFLQILDEGFVTDGFGKKLSFRKSIIIATSNASSGLIGELLGHGETPEAAKKEVIDDVVKNNVFRLEFLNRFDDIIFFSPLVNQELREVAGLKLEALAKRIKKQKNIDLTFDESVPGVILERGYEPTFGARSLNRYIEDKIEDVVVRKVISGEVAEGGSIVITSADLG
jgi:ATP-dependent Clp protease ATP-binding subunit ClpC